MLLRRNGPRGCPPLAVAPHILGRDIGTSGDLALGVADAFSRPLRRRNKARGQQSVQVAASDANEPANLAVR